VKGEQQNDPSHFNPHQYRPARKVGGVLPEFVAGRPGMVIATLADPDGNYFQLVSMETG